MIFDVPDREKRAGERPMAIDAAQADAHALLGCIECSRVWADPGERWRMKVTDDAPVDAVLYCETCATREFGPASRHVARAAE